MIDTERKPLLDERTAEAASLGYFIHNEGEVHFENDKERIKLVRAGIDWALLFYEDRIASGELVRRDELVEKVQSLIRTVAFNMFYATMRAVQKEWEPHIAGASPNWPPIPEANTVMKDGMDGVEKDFTKQP